MSPFGTALAGVAFGRHHLEQCSHGRLWWSPLYLAKRQRKYYTSGLIVGCCVFGAVWCVSIRSVRVGVVKSIRQQPRAGESAWGGKGDAMGCTGGGRKEFQGREACVGAAREAAEGAGWGPECGRWCHEGASQVPCNATGCLGRHQW